LYAALGRASQGRREMPLPGLSGSLPRSCRASARPRRRRCLRSAQRGTRCTSALRRLAANAADERRWPSSHSSRPGRRREEQDGASSSMLAFAPWSDVHSMAGTRGRP
jgi:hypothetical protein